MNTYLINRFSLSTDLNSTVGNPGITEVNYADIQKIQQQLQSYLEVPFKASEHLKVFDIEDLLQFLEQAAEEFAALCTKV